MLLEMLVISFGTADSSLLGGTEVGVKDRRKELKSCCCTMGRKGRLWKSKVRVKYIPGLGNYVMISFRLSSSQFANPPVNSR